MTGLSASSLCDEDKDVIQQSIDTRLAAVGAHGIEITGSNKPQILASITNYLTAQDWVALNSPHISMHGMMQVILSRYQRVGVRYFAEETHRWIIALLAHQLTQQSGVYPKYAAIYDMLQELSIDNIYLYITTRIRNKNGAYEICPCPKCLSHNCYGHMYMLPVLPPVFTFIQRFAARSPR